MASPIPIRNIYFLLIYAWNRLAEGELTDISSLESNEIADLFASVMINGVNHLLRRGLDQNYLTHEAEIAGVRGRINVGATARRMLIAHGKAHCEFDELSVDTLPNQILRSTVRRIAKVESLSGDLRFRLRGVNRELGGISVIPLSKQSFRKVQLHGNNRFYRFLLNVCELVLDWSMLDESSGSYRFRDYIRDENRLPALFEDFVFNFYRHECPHLAVTKERIEWQAESSGDSNLSFLPSMRTDISIRSPHHTLIIDTKFYKKTFQTYVDHQSVHSANLYQIFAYLKNLEARGGNDATADGILLYPTVTEKVRLEYRLPNHNLRVCTVGLGGSWQNIRDELLEILSN